MAYTTEIRNSKGEWVFDGRYEDYEEAFRRTVNLKEYNTVARIIDRAGSEFSPISPELWQRWKRKEIGCESADCEDFGQDECFFCKNNAR